MTPALFRTDIDDALNLFMGTAIGRAEDLYTLDGETAFRRQGGTIETFDIELGTTGGLS